MRLSHYELEQMIREHVSVMYDHSLPDGTFNCKLEGVGQAVDTILETERAKTPRSTSWWVLVKQVGDKWEPMCCIDQYDERWEEEDLPEFTQIIPIAHPDDVPEWDGF